MLNLTWSREPAGRVQYMEPDWIITDGRSPNVATVYGRQNLNYCRPDATAIPEGEAHARLIVAAPKLAAACEEAFHELRIRHGAKDGDACYETLRAVLIEAIGPQPWLA